MKKIIFSLFIFIILLSRSFCNDYYDNYWKSVKDNYVNENWEIKQNEQHLIESFTLRRLGRISTNNINDNCLVTIRIDNGGVVLLTIMTQYNISSCNGFTISFRNEKNEVIDYCYFEIFPQLVSYDYGLYIIPLIPPQNESPQFLTVPAKCEALFYSLLNFNTFNISIECHDNKQHYKILTDLRKLPSTRQTVDYLLYYAVIARDVNTVRAILENNPNILLEDKCGYALLINCFMDYYEKFTENSIELTKSRKINELLVEFGIDKAKSVSPLDMESNN